MESAIAFAKILRTALSFLDSEQEYQLITDVESVCQQLLDSSFRIAVLAPFNFGKSTLLNALLGQEIMPHKCIRTTGAAIKVKYGKKLETYVTLKSGEVIKSSQAKILEDYAVLDSKGKRRNDVLTVEVFYPHPLLKKGVELVDLPGTNDREEQDSLVKEQLLKVDLVVQILNAQQPFTLGEQEALQNWLVNRGINNVVFVLNWMNKLETKQDCRHVYEQVSSLTKQFRLDFKSDLPKNIKNLYRVDALPAFQAKRKGSIVRTINSGLATFEATLHTIFLLQKSETYTNRIPRVKIISTELKQTLQAKSKYLIAQINQAEIIRKVTIKRNQKRSKILQEEFNQRIVDLRNWLTITNLKKNYTLEAAIALQDSEFNSWKETFFDQDLLVYQQPILQWVEQASNELKQDLLSPFLSFSFPQHPTVKLPSRPKRNLTQKIADIFTKGSNKRQLEIEYETRISQVYEEAIEKYFTEFSQEALNTLNNYENQIQPLIVFPIPPETPETINQKNQLIGIEESLQKLKTNQQLKAKKSSTQSKNSGKLTILIIFWKFFLLTLFSTVTNK